MIDYHQGDAREVIERLGVSGVSLIYTDPLYQNLSDYSWLQEISKEILGVDGNTLAYTNSKWLARTLRTIESDNPVLSAVQNTGGGLNGKIIAKTYHLVWIHGSNPKRHVADGFISTPWSSPHSHNHKWVKNPKHIAHIINAFTEEGDMILDPFAGAGNIGVMAHTLNRSYIGIELDKETYARGLAGLKTLADQPRLYNDEQTGLFGE